MEYLNDEGEGKATEMEDLYRFISSSPEGPEEEK